MDINEVFTVSSNGLPQRLEAVEWGTVEGERIVLGAKVETLVALSEDGKPHSFMVEYSRFLKTTKCDHIKCMSRFNFNLN